MKKLALLAQPFIQWPLSFFSFSFEVRYLWIN